MARSMILGLGALLAAIVASHGCDDPLSQSECHRQAVERYGCCPVCDAECRAVISQECTEIHDAPLPRDDAEGGSSDTGDGGGEDEPKPKPQ